MFDAGALEAAVDGGAVHVEVAADLSDWCALAVGGDYLVDDGGGDAAVSRCWWRLWTGVLTWGAIGAYSGCGMVRKLSAKDHQRFRRSGGCVSAEVLVGSATA